MNLQVASPSGTGSRVLDDLADVIGEEAACKLAFRFRGLRLYIPKDPASDPRIAEAIGEDLAARLCDALYRTTIPMPVREVERRMVHSLAAQGMTRQAIAERLHITERQVYRLLESAAPAIRRVRRARPIDPRQIDMF
ncbi:helix-turn-helix domain-containing protein [Novosphingobium sp.]|uniref:helix-turn-helix domain-containing protein n=1 Tax=Novosphingobium sp. TaxID=1874826 RepID=UPI002611C89E|nr:helix-turn-helix domain-containing protein [Novosphingobium sp.]